MNLSKLYYFLVVFFILPMLLVQNSGCEKDYSYEGGDTTTIISDPILDSILPAGEFPVCSLCHPTEDLTIGTWSFKMGNSYLCGGTTNSGFFGGYTKMDITFFGPSACSIDTGLVMSIFLPVPLDQDRYNIDATYAAFYYYDHHAPKDIFDSEPEKPFTVTVRSFILSTGIATGTFSGTVFKANGDTAFVAEGRYKVKIK
jgi:hypothetical protein